eukprot:TRINITY_DN35296_c0_g1_i1.p1 TRINITY_DN35296_c0_g1~~TRINITY_DN35296_c0_g1_i1.p1  ORF type:complete len:548 (-),score=104.30 TRINITY_DN35296_c0_g1_i1:442-2085(-)
MALFVGAYPHQFAPVVGGTLASRRHTAAEFRAGAADGVASPSGRGWQSFERTTACAVVAGAVAMATWRRRAHSRGFGSKAAPEAAPQTVAVEGEEKKPAWTVESTDDRGKIVLAGAKGFQTGDVIIDEPPIILLDNGFDNLMKLVRPVYALIGPEFVKVERLFAPETASPHLQLAKRAGVRGESLRQVLPVLPHGCANYEDAFRILKIIEANAYFAAGMVESNTRALYVGLCRVNHSCMPNALARGGTHAGYCQVVATETIPPHEEVTWSYLSVDELALPTAERRKILSETWQFHCCCPRCAVVDDPMRVGRCPKCEAATSAAFRAAEEAPASCVECGSSFGEEFHKDAAREEAELLAFYTEVVGDCDVLEAGLQTLTRSDGETPDEDKMAQYETQAGLAMKLTQKIDGKLKSVEKLDWRHWAVARLNRKLGRLLSAFAQLLESKGEGGMAQVLTLRSTAALQKCVDAESSFGFPDGIMREEHAKDLVSLASAHGAIGRTDAAVECCERAADEFSKGCLHRRGERLLGLEKQIAAIRAAAYALREQN